MIRSFQGLAFYPIVLGCSAAPLPYQASEVDLCAAIAVVDGVLGSDLNIEQSAAQFDALKKRSDLSSPVSALNVVCDNNLTGARPGLGLVGSGVDQVSFSRDGQYALAKGSTFDHRSGASNYGECILIKAQDVFQLNACKFIYTEIE